jgi:hypothetical protein
MLERCGYREALYLSALIAAVNSGLFLYAQWYTPHLGYDSAIYAVAALIVLLGLWLSSRIARYAGATFYIFWTVVVVFTLWRLTKLVVNVVVVLFVAMAVLSLAAALIQVFSTRFAREFAAERKKRPSYKKYLLHAFTFVIILAVATGILIDIVSFIQRASGK